jgi:hypothetical protein
MKIGNTTIITDLSKLNDKITWIKTSGKKIQEAMHQAGVSAMVHARKCGDVGPCERLIESMPMSFRRAGMAAWMEAHMPLVEDDSGKAIDHKNPKLKLVKGRKEEDFLVDAAEEKPFWEFTAEKDPKPLTKEAFMKMVAKQAGKLAKQGDITPQQLQAIAAGCEAVLNEVPVEPNTELRVVNG